MSIRRGAIPQNTKKDISHSNTRDCLPKPQVSNMSVNQDVLDAAQMCRPPSGIDISGLDPSNLDINVRIGLKIIAYIKHLEHRINEYEKIRDVNMSSANDIISTYKFLNESLVAQVRDVQRANNLFIAFVIASMFIMFAVFVLLYIL